MYPSLTTYRQRKNYGSIFSSNRDFKKPTAHGEKSCREDGAFKIIDMSRQEPQTYKLHHLFGRSFFTNQSYKIRNVSRNGNNHLLLFGRVYPTLMVIESGKHKSVNLSAKMGKRVYPIDPNQLLFFCY
jgi:hypothetical protein